MKRILVRMGISGDAEWKGDDGVVRTGWPSPGPEERVTILVPAEDVLVLEVPRIAGNQRQWSKAIPFLVEDLLVLPIESQHVAWTWAGGNEPILVCVVAHTRMEGWINRLRDAGLEPEAMVPESLALPLRVDAPSLLVDGRRAVLRYATAQALSGTTDEIVAIVDCTEPVGETNVWLVGNSQPPFSARTTSVIPHALHVFDLQDDALNLLQGAYLPRNRVNGLARHWRRTAVLASIALLLLAAHPVIDRHKLVDKVAEQRQEMEQLYRQAVPGSGAVDDPARRLQSALASRGLGQSDGAMRLLAQAAPVIAADGHLSLDSLEYRDRRLALIVQATAVSDLDRLRQALAQSGLEAEITGTTPGTNGVEGRLHVREVP